MTRLIPMLPTSSVAASIDFYCKLGFEVEQQRDEWGWAMLRFGQCRIMLDRSINLDRHAPRQSVLYLYPDDIVTYHAQVKRSGLTVPELELTFYGMREFRIEDPDGNRLWIGQNQLEND